MSDVTVYDPDGSPRNPATITYPATLPVEIALKTAPLKEICEAYGITREEWDELRRDPVFLHDLTEITKELKKDGMSFRLKARLQSEELLKTSWTMIHDKTVSAAVRADLLKFTVRAAGLEAKSELGPGGNNFQINIQF